MSSERVNYLENKSPSLPRIILPLSLIVFCTATQNFVFIQSFSFLVALLVELRFERRPFFLLFPMLSFPFISFQCLSGLPLPRYVQIISLPIRLLANMALHRSSFILFLSHSDCIYKIQQGCMQRLIQTALIS